MEDNRQPISRLKQYYVVRDHSEKEIGDWEKGQIVDVDPEVAIPYVGAGILVPLASAIATGLIPKASPSKPTDRKPTPDSKTAEAPAEPLKKKTLIKSGLKAAVTAKKEILEPASPPEAILTPSNQEASTPAEPKLTPQEQAIKAKIAALKKSKS